MSNDYSIIIENQAKILANQAKLEELLTRQATIIKNQETIQEKVNTNQQKLDDILANQALIIKNQQMILNNQEQVK
jgi:hypothetical protein